MDIEEFDSQLKYININGVTLNIEERMQLQLAFQQLQNDIIADEVLFWGKITGRDFINCILNNK